MKQQFDYKEDLSELAANNITNEHVVNGIVSFELKRHRYPICKSCDSFQKDLKLCGECSCFMPLKTLMVRSSCPRDKW
jgi:hypothetical protein